MSDVRGLASLGTLDAGNTILEKPLTKKELDRISSDAQMAENALVVVNPGIAAIGYMLASIGSKSVDDGSVTPDLINAVSLQDIGHLIESLGLLSHQLHHSIGHINDIKVQHDILIDKQSRS